MHSLRFHAGGTAGSSWTLCTYFYSNWSLVSSREAEGRAERRGRLGFPKLPGSPLLPSRDGSPPQRVRLGKVAGGAVGPAARAGSWAGPAASCAAGSGVCQQTREAISNLHALLCYRCAHRLADCGDGAWAVPTITTKHAARPDRQCRAPAERRAGRAPRALSVR